VNKQHDLKTWPEFFEAIIKGTKTFEIRKNDRFYQVGDTLRLREYNIRAVPPVYTGRETLRVVRYIVYDFEGLASGYCIMSIDVPQTESWETSL